MLEVLGRIRSAMRANIDLERSLARARGVKTMDAVTICLSSDFERLDCEAGEMENALWLQLHRASNARTSAKVEETSAKMEESMKQAEVQHRQRMMIACIALVYIQVMLAAGIAAVDFKETHGLLASMAAILGPTSIMSLAVLGYFYLPTHLTAVGLKIVGGCENSTDWGRKTLSRLWEALWRKSLTEKGSRAPEESVRTSEGHTSEISS